MPIERSELERMRTKPVKAVGPAIAPFCLDCGYNLAGAISSKCPECGAVFVAKEWRRKASELVHRRIEIRESNEWIDRAFWMGCVGLAVKFGVLFLQGGRLAVAGSLLAVVCGFSAVFLGLGVFRAGSLPAWAREGNSTDAIIDPPKYAKGVATSLLGAVTLLAATLL